MSLYKNKYRIESTRLRSWDYASNGYYFITICTKNRECFFGKIANGKMEFSNIGNIAKKYWQEIPKHFPFVKLDKFIVIPDHIHGIIIIDKPTKPQNVTTAFSGRDAFDGRDARSCVSTGKTNISNKFGPQSGNIASIIRGFKIGVTKYGGNNNIYFGWQPRFHDHVIRNRQDLYRIQKYIQNNPYNWRG